MIICLAKEGHTEQPSLSHACLIDHSFSPGPFVSPGLFSHAWVIYSSHAWFISHQWLVVVVERLRSFFMPGSSAINCPEASLFVVQLNSTLTTPSWTEATAADCRTFVKLYVKLHVCDIKCLESVEQGSGTSSSNKTATREPTCFYADEPVSPACVH